MTVTAATSPTRRGPLASLLQLFSNVWLGVTLLALLFVYSWIGSAGLPIYMGGNPLTVDGWVFEQIRQWPGLEMTEFEWFNWWPFELLIGLIAANITITTVRRIKLNTINLGVWLIHTGILILCLGSWMYFSNKVEGDAPVARREVVAELPGGNVVRFPAVPGTSAMEHSDEGHYQFFVQSVDPDWVLLSGPNEGSKAYSVQVRVDGPQGRFIRQFIAGMPEATQDSLFVTDGDGPPLQRAVKVLGRPLVDEQIVMRLEYAPQDWFYLANWVEKSWALYLREKDGGPWVQRRVDGLPLYNDYVSSLEEVWPPDGETLPPRQLHVDVPAQEPGDPLPGVTLGIASYLRYARMQDRWMPGTRIYPTATVRLEDGMGEFFDHELVAFDPARASASRNFVALKWARDVSDREHATHAEQPTLVLEVPGSGVRHEHVVRDVSLRNTELPFETLEGTDYAYRVQFVQDLQDPEMPATIVGVELRQGDRAWRRFLSPGRTFEQDVDADGGLTPSQSFPLDDGIRIDYLPGQQPAAVTLVAGPGDDDLGLVLAIGSPDDGVYNPVAVGEAFALGRGDTITVSRFSARSERQRRPGVVPRRLRDRDARESYSMVRVQFIEGGRGQDLWVPFHQYPIEGPSETLRRYWYDPVDVTLSDGRVVELILSRARLPLPDPVVLDDFHIASQVGGFTGRTSSILNWTSAVRFADGVGAWTDPMDVSVNAPAEHDGLWFFQAQWDPPSGPRFRGDPPSKGLNYTVLGVGNRVGVGVQLLGCCIAVLGMIYAFYVKPQLIKRRRQAAALRKQEQAA